MSQGQAPVHPLNSSQDKRAKLWPSREGVAFTVYILYITVVLVPQRCPVLDGECDVEPGKGKEWEQISLAEPIHVFSSVIQMTMSFELKIGPNPMV